MNVAICDDLKEDRQTLKNALYQLEQEKNIEFDILEFETPEALYKDCDARDELKIIFFDVYMGDILGTDAAKKMRQYHTLSRFSESTREFQQLSASI